MKKLTLHLDHLRIESFGTDAAATRGGTVNGAQVLTRRYEVTCAVECYATPSPASAPTAPRGPACAAERTFGADLVQGSGDAGNRGLRSSSRSTDMSFAPAPDGADPALAAGPACRRSRLSPAVRFGIFFGAPFALKLALPVTGLPATAQVLALAVAATGLVWRFWWGCGESRRGGVLLLAVLWTATLGKIVL